MKEKNITKQCTSIQLIDMLMKAMQRKARKIKASPSAAMAISLIPTDEETGAWLDEEQIGQSETWIRAAGNNHFINPKYMRTVGDIYDFRKKARKEIVFRNNKKGLAAYYRPLYRTANDKTIYLEVFVFVICDDAMKSEIIATSVEEELIKLIDGKK